MIISELYVEGDWKVKLIYSEHYVEVNLKGSTDNFRTLCGDDWTIKWITLELYVEGYSMIKTTI